MTKLLGLELLSRRKVKECPTMRTMFVKVTFSLRLISTFHEGLSLIKTKKVKHTCTVLVCNQSRVRICKW